MFGPLFHLAHDKWSRKLRPEDTPPHLTPESSFPFGWHSDGPVGFPEVDGHVAMNILRFGYFTSSCEHDGSGTIEMMRGSHRSMRCAGAQSSLHFQPIGTTKHLQNPEVLTSGDEGEDPALYSQDHVEIRGPAGTIVAFQNGVWHRALPLGPSATGKPRSIVYFGYCPTMLRPLHRPVPCTFCVHSSLSTRRLGVTRIAQVADCNSWASFYAQIVATSVALLRKNVGCCTRTNHRLGARSHAVSACGD